MKGERVFDDDIDLPQDISDELCAIIGEYIEEDLEDLKEYFQELMTFQRAVFMIEVTAPLEALHKAEYLLHESGYHVYNHMDFGLEYEEIRKSEIPGQPEPSGEFYISLRSHFTEIAKVSATGFGGAALEGLMFGYDVKNIIAYLDMPELSPEEVKEYYDSFLD